MHTYYFNSSMALIAWHIKKETQKRSLDGILWKPFWSVIKWKVIWRKLVPCKDVLHRWTRPSRCWSSSWKAMNLKQFLAFPSSRCHQIFRGHSFHSTWWFAHNDCGKGAHNSFPRASFYCSRSSPEIIVSFLSFYNFLYKKKPPKLM